MKITMGGIDIPLALLHASVIWLLVSPDIAATLSHFGLRQSPVSSQLEILVGLLHSFNVSSRISSKVSELVATCQRYSYTYD